MELSNENETTHILRVIVRKAIEVPGYVHQIRRSDGGCHRLVHKSILKSSRRAWYASSFASPMRSDGGIFLLFKYSSSGIRKSLG